MQQSLLSHLFSLSFKMGKDSVYLYELKECRLMQ
jgi:hypothetical protein